MQITISDENFYENCKKHPVIVPSYYAACNFICIIALIFMLCSIIFPAYAQTESFVIEESNYTEWSFAGSGPSAGYTLKQIVINYDNVRIPEHFLWYFNRISGSPESRSSTFTLKNGGNVISTGTISVLNGSFIGGTYNTYIFLEFDSWDSHGLTGLNTSNYLYINDVSFNSSILPSSEKGTAYSNPMYMAFATNNVPVKYAIDGYQIYRQFGYWSQAWTVSNITPISKTMLFNFTVTKNGVSKPTIFSNTTILWVGAQDSNTVSGTLSGADLTFQMFVPPTYRKINSSEYFNNYVMGTEATPTPTTPIVPVTSSAENPIAVIDGKSDGLIPNSQVSIYNHNSATWSNITAATGYFHYTAHISDVLDIYGDAIGYEDNSITGFVWGGDTVVNLILIPEIGGAAGTDTSLVYITVLDYDSDAPIEGALAVISNTSAFTTQSGYTNSAGYLELTIPHNVTVYGTLSVSKSPAYYSVTMPITITMNDKSAPVYLHRKTSVTPTYTIPTQPTTIAVTPTIQGWNGAQLNETSCYQPGHYPEGFGYWDVIRNGIACSGVKGQTNQNLALALIIMMICALVLARYAKGIGALAGIIAGAAFSFGMNILPLWILITLIIICGIIIAKMIMGSGGK